MGTFRAMEKKQHVLIIGYVWPEPDSSAAGRRMMELISLFQSRGWKVTFASASAKTEHMVDLTEWGIQTVNIAINSSSFDDVVADLQPSVVMFDRFVTEEQFGWRVAEQCPDALRLLDTEDLHCLRKARQKAIENGNEFSRHDLLTAKIAKREIASILRCDLSLIISEAEMDLLQHVFEIDPHILHYLPFLLDPVGDEAMQSWLPYASRNHFVTIGNFRHAPNWDAILYLKKQVWPRIRKTLKRAQMHIYGAYPSPKAWELHSPENGFYIEGRAENAGEVVGGAKVCLAPLRIGAGLKGKLVEAMQCGTPSVTTPIGAEGLAGDLPWSGKIAENIEEIVNGAVRLFTNQSEWERAQRNGIRIINERFAKLEYGQNLFERIANIRENLEHHRLENFMGRMLMHHSMASTKYMGRWIEAKNSD